MTEDQKKVYDNQINLQRIAQEKKEIMSNIIVKDMAETIFPANKLHPKFAEIVTNAIYHSIPIVNRIPLKDQVAAMKAVKANPDKISLAHFKVLADSVDAIAPAWTGLPFDEYTAFIDQLFVMVAEWEKMLRKIQDEAVIKMEAEWKMKQKVLEGSNGAIIKPITGQA